jgi:hypothetical protein
MDALSAESRKVNASAEQYLSRLAVRSAGTRSALRCARLAQLLLKFDQLDPNEQIRRIKGVLNSPLDNALVDRGLRGLIGPEPSGLSSKLSQVIKDGFRLSYATASFLDQFLLFLFLATTIRSDGSGGLVSFLRGYDEAMEPEAIRDYIHSYLDHLITRA